MTAVRVDPTTYITASDEFSSISRNAMTSFNQAQSGLRRYASMAGDDPGGEQFATNYDQGAAAILQAMYDLGVLTSKLDRGIMASGSLHDQAESLVAGQPASGAFTVRPAVPEMCPAPPPSAFGGTPGGTPDLWETIKDLIGTVWPNADTDKMRQAGTTWNNIGDDLTAVAREIQRSDNSLSVNRSGEITRINTEVNELAADIRSLADSAREIGDACTEYADNVDEAHAEVLKMLAQLAIEIAAGVGLSVALSFVTFGGAGAVGAAAIAARITAVATRVGGVLGRVLSLAAQIATRFSDLGFKIQQIAQKFQRTFKIGIEVASGSGAAMLAETVQGDKANFLAAGLSGGFGGLLSGGFSAAFATRTLTLSGRLGVGAASGAIGGAGGAAADGLIRDGKINLASVAIGAGGGAIGGTIGGALDGGGGSRTPSVDAPKVGGGGGGGTPDIGGGKGPDVGNTAPTVGGGNGGAPGASGSPGNGGGGQQPGGSGAPQSSELPTSSQSKPDSTPEPKPDSPEPKPDSPEPKPDSPEQRPEPKPESEPKAEPKPDPTPEPKPDPEPTPEPKPDPEPTPEPKPAPDEPGGGVVPPRAGDSDFADHVDNIGDDTPPAQGDDGRRPDGDDSEPKPDGDDADTHPDADDGDTTPDGEHVTSQPGDDGATTPGEAPADPTENPILPPDPDVPPYDLTHPREVMDNATHNPDSPDVTLGKWMDGDPNSYDTQAQANGHTYFSTAEWDAIKQAQGLDNQGMFDLYNTWFLDMQVNDRKTFHFTHDPRGDQGFLGQELEWLEFRGYVFDPDTMTARPKTP